MNGLKGAGGRGQYPRSPFCDNKPTNRPTGSCQVSKGVGACCMLLLSQVEDHDRTPAQTRLSIAIEHAEPCKIRDYVEGGRPLIVISRAMSEGNLAAQQAICIRKKGVDEVSDNFCQVKWHPRPAAGGGVCTDGGWMQRCSTRNVAVAHFLFFLFIF